MRIELIVRENSLARKVMFLRTENQTLRSLGVFLTLLAVLLQIGLLSGALWAWENQIRIRDLVRAEKFETSSEIESYAQRAGLSGEGYLYLRASFPEIVPAYEFDRYCSRNEPGIGVLGCYKPASNQIFLYDVTDDRLDSIEPVVAAHEMLHAVWFRMSDAEQASLRDPLEETFASLGPGHPLVPRIDEYEAMDPDSRIPELYAIIGTEVSAIPRVLEDHYAIYFDDRSKVADLAAEVYVVFETIQAELQLFSSQLDSRNAEIEGLRYTYEETAQRLTSEIELFNKKASTPGAFPSKSQFDTARAQLLAEQERLEELRLMLQDKIDQFNSLLSELETLNEEVSELNQGINIRLEAEEELQPSATDFKD